MVVDARFWPAVGRVGATTTLFGVEPVAQHGVHCGRSSRILRSARTCMLSEGFISSLRARSRRRNHKAGVSLKSWTESIPHWGSL